MPLLTDIGVWYIEKFQLLSRSRQLGYGTYGPIPISEIILYANEFGTVNSKSQFLSIIVKIDDYFLDVMSKKTNKED